MGVAVCERPLAVGDYVVGDAVIERKTVRDLGSAIIRGRFWPQIGRLRNRAKRGYLLIEGSDLDLSPLRPASVRGTLLAVADLGLDVIRSMDPDDTATWLAVLARRSRRPSKPRPAYSQRQKRQDVPAAMLAAVPGISTYGAEALLGRFGDVRSVVNAGADEWLAVPGIGPKRAAALAEAISHLSRPASRPQSGRQGPST